MSWFNTEGRCPHHVIRSSTRYIRNLTAIPFKKKANATDLGRILESVDTLLSANGFRKEEIPAEASALLSAFAEKQFADKELLLAEGERAIYLNEPCNLSVAVGGRDLISIRAILSGRAIQEAKNIASGAEELLDHEFEFAYSPELGYLSPDPHTCGSGEEFSSLLYLPALSHQKRIEEMRQSCRGFGADLSPYLCGNENAGDLFTLSYIPTHTQSENEAVERFDRLTEKLIELEKQAERMISAERSKLIDDRAHRAFGILCYAKRISEAELLSLISDIRLFLAIGGEGAQFDLSCTDLNYLLAEGMSFSVIARNGGCGSSEECESLRAGFVTERVRSKQNT